jgi:hypothetical protein
MPPADHRRRTLAMDAAGEPGGGGRSVGGLILACGWPGKLRDPFLGRLGLRGDRRGTGDGNRTRALSLGITGAAFMSAQVSAAQSRLLLTSRRSSWWCPACRGYQGRDGRCVSEMSSPIVVRARELCASGVKVLFRT